MLNVREAVYSALTTALGDTPVYALYPGRTASYPAVSYYQSTNTRFAQADGDEHLTEIAFVIDVWSKTVKQGDDLAAQIDGAMTGMGFRREMCMDVEDINCKHLTTRYRAVIDQTGTAYQG